VYKVIIPITHLKIITELILQSQVEGKV